MGMGEKIRRPKALRLTRSAFHAQPLENRMVNRWVVRRQVGLLVAGKKEARGERREARGERREARGERREARGERREARGERREARGEEEYKQVTFQQHRRAQARTAKTPARLNQATRLAGTASNDNTSLQAVQYISATSMTDLDRDDEV
ncbi:hypothetical protein V8E53_000925 [Lactarius tabidus]